MSVGYKPYVKSVVFRIFIRNTSGVLTETPAMVMKPGSRNTPKAEITYKICECAVNSVSIEASGSGTYPNAAINETRLDEQSEDPIDPHRPIPFTQVLPYRNAVLPTQMTW